MAMRDEAPWPLPPVTPAAALAGLVHEFERAYNPITGTDGWRPRGIPDFDPVPPAMCIHDLLEHFPECGAAVHEEYLALGAAHYLRNGRDGYFALQNQRISNDLPKPAFGMLFHHISHQRLPIKAAPLVYEGFDAVTPFTNDLEMQRTIRNARRLFTRTYSEDDLDGWLKYALPWMRIGYRRAIERYRRISPADVSALWLRAQRAIENLSHYAHHGQVLTFSIDPVGLTFTASVR